MTTHCSILAWKIQWAEESGRLQSIGLPRCGHNWASELTSSHYCSLLYYCYRSIYKTLLITKQQFYQTEKSPMCTLLILKQCDIKCTGNHGKKRELQIEYWYIPDRSTEAFGQPTDPWEAINNCCLNSLNSEIIYNATITKWYILWKIQVYHSCNWCESLDLSKLIILSKTFHQHSMLAWVRRIKKLITPPSKHQTTIYVWKTPMCS